LALRPLKTETSSQITAETSLGEGQPWEPEDAGQSGLSEGAESCLWDGGFGGSLG